MNISKASFFDEFNHPSKNDSLDDDVGILQENFDDASNEKKNDQEEINNDE